MRNSGCGASISYHTVVLKIFFALCFEGMWLWYFLLKKWTINIYMPSEFRNLFMRHLCFIYSSIIQQIYAEWFKVERASIQIIFIASKSWALNNEQNILYMLEIYTFLQHFYIISCSNRDKHSFDKKKACCSDKISICITCNTWSLS